MKRILVMILAVTALSISANAQVERKSKGDHPKKEGRKMGKHHGHDMMKDLNLTDAQKQQFKTNSQAFKQKMQDLKKNDNITVKEYRTRKEALMKEQRASMENLLTADQKATLAKKKAERTAKHDEKQKKHFDKMKEKLNLTADQSTKLNDSRELFKARFKAIKDNDKLSKEERKEKLTALKKEQKDYVDSVLSKEQKEKMQEMRKKKGERPAKK